MARWEKIKSRGSVEDRRGLSAGGFGGLGIVGIALVIGLNLLGNGGEINVQQVLEQLQSVQTSQLSSDATVQPEEFQGLDSYEEFASTVVGSTNDVWNQVFSSNNKSYEEPTLQLFRGSTSTGCGLGSSQTGPFYCPADQKIYIDETFFDQLETQLGAQGGDVAEAYVIAHEVGHHVQNLLGLLNSGGSNEESIKTELQADCFAGVWAYSLRDDDVFEPGEFDEAIDAAESVGDDRIQEATVGRTNPESWTHGSSAERKKWLNKGFETGEPSACNP